MRERTNVFLTDSTIRDLKICCAVLKMKICEVMEEAVREWIEKRKDEVRKGFL